jgi:WD40 repeat protein
MPEPTSPAAAIGAPSPSAGQNERNNPYVGPRALGPGEPIYGRERELLDLRDLLIAERIVLLYSPSGAGKTSLIQAGLIPEMKREEFGVLPLMRVGKNSATTAGNRYLASAILSLEEQLAPGDGSLPVADIAGISFADYLERREGLLPAGDSKLLIFDQFEEILTVDPLDQEGKAEFFAQVGAVLRNTSRWALFSIREDYVAALDPYTRAVPTRLKSNLRLDLLTPEAARLAIEEPARNRNVSFTPQATSQLIDDLRRVTVQSRAGTYEPRLGPYVEPVHLQVVCSQLWEKPRSNPAEIGVAELATIGDVDSALGEYYAAHVGEVAREADVKEKAIREWFDRSLITESGIRSEVMWQPGGSEGLNDAAIDALEAAHLVRREERRDATWLELSHNRLVTPIRANNARWFEGNLSLLQQQAVLWQRQNQNEALCLRGQALEEAEEWAAQHPEELTKTDQGFLKTSREKESVRATALLRWRLALSTIGIVITGSLAAIALVQCGEAVKQKGEAVKQKGRAEDEAKISSARGLAAHASRLLNERLDLAMLLAVEAAQQVDLPETRGTLLTAALSNPRLVAFLHGHQSTVGALAFDRDGTLLAAGDYKKRIVLWNVKTHQPKRVFGFKEFKDVVRSIAFSPDKKYMAASSKDGSIVLFDLKSNTNEATFSFPRQNGHSGNIWSIAFSPDSKLLASGGSDGKVIIWRVAEPDKPVPQVIHGAQPNETGSVKTTSEANPVRSVAFNAAGSLLAAGCADGNVLIWEKKVDGWAQFDDFPAHIAAPQEKKPPSVQVTGVAFHPNEDNLLAIASKDWTVSLRDVIGKRSVARGRHRDSLTGLAFSPDGEALATAGQDGTLRLWRVPKFGQSPAPSVAENPSPVMERIPDLEAIGPPFTGHVGWVLAIAYSADGRTVASGGIDRQAILWDTQYYLPDTANAAQTQEESVMAISPGGKYEATGYSSGAVVCRDRVTSAATSFTDHTKSVRNLCFSRNGQFLLTTRSDESSGVVTVTDLASPASLPVSLEIPSGKLSFAALSPDGKKVAVALDGGQVFLWDVTSPRWNETPLEGVEDSWIYAVAFDPDGKRLAAGGTNQYVVSWDGPAHRHASQYADVHNGSIRVAIFSPDGNVLATGSGDNTVLLWDVATGKPLGPALTAHRGAVIALAFSPDGGLLASGSEDKSVVLWDIRTQQQIGPRLVRHADKVRALAFSEDGKTLFSGSFYGDIYAWDLDLASVSTRIRTRVNRNLTTQEWEVYLGKKQPYRKTWSNVPWPNEGLAESNQ